jgi:Tfp pilus assembly protein PilO
VTARDRIIIVVALAAAALAGFWFVALAPKRSESAELKAQIQAANQQLAGAQQQAAQARRAKARYDADYAQVAKLGKAVPKDDALPSLLYQLQSAAHAAKIDFTSLLAAGASGQAASGGATAAAKSANGASTSTSSSTATGSSAAPATQSATAGLPPGATVGSAGFPTMPFSFVFNGSFFDMQRFLRDVQRFVRVKGERVDARGRLLSIDGFALSASPAGFPDVTAKITATAYLQSPNDDSSSAASPAASANAAPSAMASGGTR